MTECIFVSDLHGKTEKYALLLSTIEEYLPDIVFIGGDLLPNHMAVATESGDFITGFLIPRLQALRDRLKDRYPMICLIMGNDDARSEEVNLLKGEDRGLYSYLNQRKAKFGKYDIYGYSFIPPSPFQLKDWEKYDVSRYVDPGCIPPTEGYRTTDPQEDMEYATIKQDLENLTEGEDMENAIFLFHSPPYGTLLDRAALDGQMIDHVPLDLNVGSIAIMRFIEEKQPLVTLHGHIHESTRLTGHWMQSFNRTVAFNAAHDGPELPVIRFNPGNPVQAVRNLMIWEDGRSE